jgi:hypothetical protein
VAKWQLLWFEPSGCWETLTESIAAPADAVAWLTELEGFAPKRLRKVEFRFVRLRFP